MPFPFIFVDNIRLTVASLSPKFHSFKVRLGQIPAKQTLLSRKAVVPPLQQSRMAVVPPLHTVCPVDGRSLQHLPNQLFYKYIYFSEQNFCKKNSELR